MATQIVRVEWNGKKVFGQKNDREIAIFSESFAKLSEVIESLATGLIASGESVPIEKVKILSPVTTCNIICQGKNYVDHIIETGMKPEDKDFNMFFVKAASSMTDPDGPVIKPSFVQLLDYEAELALVIGKPIRGLTKITKENLHEFVAGITLANDISARDIQVPQGQWFKGKSYRTFCPVGPYFVHLTKEDLARLPSMELKLSVNGTQRQRALISQMIFPPEETLSELSGIMDLEIGDIVLTGTPSGVALRAPSATIRKYASLVFSEKKLMRMFVEKQASSPRYLKVGDKIQASLRTEDGSIDCGVQNITIQQGD